MSFHVVQKVRRNTSPLSSKHHGPVKATLSFQYTSGVNVSGCFSEADLLERSSIVRTTKKLSSDRTLTGSPLSREKCSPQFLSANPKNPIDLLDGSDVSDCSSSYLRGEWPKSDPLVTQAYFSPSNLTADKASQTPEEWCRIQHTDRKTAHKRSSSVNTSTESSIRNIKARLAKTSKEAIACNITGSSRLAKHSSPVCVVHHDFTLHTASKPIEVPYISLPRPTSSSSLDGLNQEIERLVVNTSSSSEQQIPSDGRRAPVTQELKTQLSSVVTQTPSALFELASPLDGVTVDGAGDMESAETDITKVSSSPTLTTFIPERLPPDGCEKVSVKFLEIMTAGSPVKSCPSVSSVNIGPSEKSAFNIPIVRGTVISPPHPGPLSLTVSKPEPSA